MRGTQDGRFRIAEYVMSSILSGKTTLLIRMRDLDRASFGDLDAELLSVSLAVNLTAHSGDLVWLFRRDLRSILNARKERRQLEPGNIGYGASASKLSRSSGRVYMSILPSAVRGHSLGGRSR